MKGTEFTEKVYWGAAEERADSLRRLYNAREFALALYIAGVAVESMLRAVRVGVSPEFTARHDLFELAKEVGFAKKVGDKVYKGYAADLSAVAVRWSNNHRYRSNAAILRFLKRAGLDRGIKGDVLKENARQSINSAINLIALGKSIWKT